MPKAKWLHNAVIDLGDIADYIAADNKQTARRMIARIREAARLISRMPGVERVGRVDGTREFVVPGTQYLIAYQMVDKWVEILAVRHGAQEWPEAF